MNAPGPSLFAPLFEGRAPARWLVTGAAGFIGSNLVQALLENGQSVVGLDDFSTGYRRNLDEVRAAVGEDAWRRFAFVEGDVCDAETCAWAVAGADVVLHQAALGSVPRSVDAPMKSFLPNAQGFARLLVAAKDAGVRRFVYASSSSVYGDHPALPKVEDATGRVLSPYAATKAMDEAWAQGCSAVYDLQCVGLRYFNVFGPRQDPDGAYAAVIPRWIAAMLRGEPVWINGDGQTSRDFCYVANAVQANLRAGLVDTLPSRHEVFNVAAGARTTLLELHDAILRALPPGALAAPPAAPRFRDFRAGDVRHSLADVSKAARLLGYAPTHDVAAGLGEAMRWYLGFLGGRGRARGVRAA
jgi:UDP-N-acetylglucosamine 4-epimerase